MFLAQGRGGTIVSVGSITGYVGSPMQAAYGAAKAGLASLARSVAAEYSRDGIHLNVVSCGPIATPVARAAQTGTAEWIPMGRAGESSEVADAAVFLASPLSSYVTGQSLVIDGAFVEILQNCNIVALMLSLGLVGILVELWNPGLILPGTVGGISLIVGLYGVQVLPVSAAGVLLMLLAAGFFLAEAFVVSHGALTLAGAITFVIGSLMLFDPAGEAYQVSLWTALGIAATLALLLGVALTRVVKARRNPVEVGIGRMVGGEGVVRQDGWVAVGGELWRAHSTDGTPLVPGAHVTVEAVEDDLALVVGSPHPTERA